VDEAEAEGCPQEESLRTVLRSLGIAESDLQGDLHYFPGVEWFLWLCNENQQKKVVQDFWGTKKIVPPRSDASVPIVLQTRGCTPSTAAPSSGSNSLAKQASVARCIRRFRS